MVAGGPLGFVPEGVGVGVGVGGRGLWAGRGRRARGRGRGEVVLVLHGHGADRGRLGRVEDGGVAVVDAVQHPLVCLLWGVAVEDPGGGRVVGVAPEFGGPGGERVLRLGAVLARGRGEEADLVVFAGQHAQDAAGVPPDVELAFSERPAG